MEEACTPVLNTGLRGITIASTKISDVNGAGIGGRINQQAVCWTRLKSGPDPSSMNEIVIGAKVTGINPLSRLTTQPGPDTKLSPTKGVHWQSMPTGKSPRTRPDNEHVPQPGSGKIGYHGRCLAMTHDSGTSTSVDCLVIEHGKPHSVLKACVAFSNRYFCE